MKIAKKIIALGLASSMFLAVGCSSKSAEEQDKKAVAKTPNSITLLAGSDPQTTNPLFANDRVSMTIMNALYSPLYVLDGEDKSFYLAESVDISQDYLTYTVKLRNDLKWHDGKTLTTDDILFTYDSIMDEKQNCAKRADFMIGEEPVKFIKKDDNTFEVKLPSVSMAFETTLGDLRPLPKHIFEGEADLAKSEKNNSPIGSGPYKFKELKSGESIVLEKNKDYYLGEPNLDTVAYRILQDANAADVALQNGEVQVNYVTPDQISNVEKNEKVELKIFEEGMVDNLVLDQNNKDLAKKEVRQAIAYAINRDEIISSAYGSEKYAQKAYSLLAPNALYYTDKVEKYDQDKEKAKELLKSSGVSNLKLKLGYSNHKKSLESTALVIQNNLKEVGIDLELVPLERSAFLSQLFGDSSTRTFDMALNGYVMGSDPTAYASLFTTNGSNNTDKYSNKEVDDLFAKASVETDDAKRNELYTKIQEIVVDEVALYPIAYPKSIVVIDKNYTGIDKAKLVPIYLFEDLSKLKLK